VEEREKEYCKLRERLITPFVDYCLDTLACELAEKYEDFSILMKLTERHPDWLSGFVRKFADKGFSDYQYQWYVSHDKAGEILKLQSLASDLDSSGSEANRVEQFLEHKPGLLWQHQIQLRDFEGAACTLKRLSDKENDSVKRKRHFLSLSKLALLASDAPHSFAERQANDIDTALDIILQQEMIPSGKSSSTRKPRDLDNEPPMSPTQIVATYLRSVRPRGSCNAMEAKRMLDLLVSFLSDRADFKQQQLAIWTKVFRDTDWGAVNNAEDSTTEAHKTSFFKLIDLCLQYELERFSNFVPSQSELTGCAGLVDWLKQPPKGAARTNATAYRRHYFLALGLEHGQRSLTKQLAAHRTATAEQQQLKQRQLAIDRQDAAEAAAAAVSQQEQFSV
jgi:hypothetical protein